MKYDRQKIAAMREEGYTYEQIAKELGTTKGNVSSQISLMKKSGWDITKSQKWTDEEVAYLIELRATTNLKIPVIAEELGIPYDKVKLKISQLIKEGVIEPVGHQSSPTASYSYQVNAPKSSVQELNQYVVNYITKEACPQPYASRIISYYGSWGAALDANGLPRNVGTLDPRRATTLYLLDFGEFKKYGITQRTIQQRFSGAPKFTVLDQLVENLDVCLEFEDLITQAVASRAYEPDLPYFQGNRRGKTECFIGPETQLCELL